MYGTALYHVILANKARPALQSFGRCFRAASLHLSIRMSGEAPTPKRRVLSIQSHVVHGYVGNKSATFPLQVLGFEVDAINSVQFSNHTGYKHIKGQVLKENDLADLVQGLDKNELLEKYSHLLTGYIGNESFLKEIAETVKKLRAANSELIYVCDPVMGDDGKMYVPKELLPVYRDLIIPLADIVTPNQYEVELLTGKKINNTEEAWDAINWFFDRGVKIVALSSTSFGKENELKAFLAKKNGSKYILDIPKQGGVISFTGTGDLFASLFLAHSSLNEDLGKAMEYTISTLQAVIKRTIDQMPDEAKSGKRAATSHERELKLIQSKNEIEKPAVKIFAQSA